MFACIKLCCGFGVNSDDNEDAKKKKVILYRKPNYIVNAARRKYGQSIHVIGSTREEISDFYSEIIQHTLSTTLPEEVGRTVVDIDSKCHLNKSERGDMNQENEKPEDWYDEFEITSKKATSESSSKSYQLQLTNSRETQYGADLNFKVGGSGFFNMASAGIGGGAGFKKTTAKTEQTTKGSTQEESLSQGYEVVDRLKVPPRTKVKAKITTWAVTYESKTRTQLFVDADAYITVRYRTRFAQVLGLACFTTIGRLTAQDLFGDEEDFQSTDEFVTFQRDGSISYLGEEVEITKTKTEC